jgi:hypothetical protein
MGNNFHPNYWKILGSLRRTINCNNSHNAKGGGRVIVVVVNSYLLSWPIYDNNNNKHSLDHAYHSKQLPSNVCVIIDGKIIKWTQ